MISMWRDLPAEVRFPIIGDVVVVERRVVDRHMVRRRGVIRNIERRRIDCHIYEAFYCVHTAFDLYVWVTLDQIERFEFGGRVREAL